MHHMHGRLSTFEDRPVLADPRVGVLFELWVLRILSRDGHHALSLVARQLVGDARSCSRARSADEPQAAFNSLGNVHPINTGPVLELTAPTSKTCIPTRSRQKHAKVCTGTRMSRAHAFPALLCKRSPCRQTRMAPP